MRILYVIEKMSVRGGTERILTDKMNYLAEHTGHEVVLMTLWHDDSPYAYQLSEHITRIRLNVPLPKIPMGYAPMLPLVLHRFNKYIHRIKPDVCILQRAMGCLLAAFGTHPCPAIYESHTCRDDSNHRWLLPLMERKADYVVTLTRGDANDFARARHVAVIPNFTTMQPEGRASLDSRHCIAVGRVCKEKNFMRLVRIWRQVHVSHPEWVLDIYGDGDQQDMLRQEIENCGLSCCIRMHGATDNVVEKYMQSSMLIVTSQTEGFGLTIIEAMACGVPVVAFDCHWGPADIIDNGKDGFLIDYNDDNAMVRSIERLMDDEALRHEMGTNAIGKALHYRPAAIMSQWLKLFNTMKK